MSDAVFHLDSVVRDGDYFKDFEGPLSLILLLVSKDKVSVRDIKISEITDQYVAYISKLQEQDINLGTEFVQMASHLLYLKASSVIAADAEGPGELELLLQSLEQLKAKEDFRRLEPVIPQIDDLTRRGFMSFTGSGEYFDIPIKYDHTPEELRNCLLTVIREENFKPLPTVNMDYMPKRFNFKIRDMGRRILERLTEQEKISLDTLVMECGSRGEIVAVFISVLELSATGGLGIENNNGTVILHRTDADMENILSGLSDDE